MAFYATEQALANQKTANYLAQMIAQQAGKAEENAAIKQGEIWGNTIKDIANTAAKGVGDHLQQQEDAKSVENFAKSLKDAGASEQILASVGGAKNLGEAQKNLATLAAFNTQARNLGGGNAVITDEFTGNKQYIQGDGSSTSGKGGSKKDDKLFIPSALLGEDLIQIYNKSSPEQKQRMYFNGDIEFNKDGVVTFSEKGVENLRNLGKANTTQAMQEIQSRTSTQSQTPTQQPQTPTPQQTKESEETIERMKKNINKEVEDGKKNNASKIETGFNVFRKLLSGQL